MRILSVVGARPNFVKIAPILRALERAGRPGLEIRLVHTGQHYDSGLSDSFFEDLGIRPPDLHLGVGSGTHGEQTARILTAVEAILVTDRPDIVVVVGDVNSTLATALAAAKLLVPVAHVEAGLRSWDRTMPEEVNRIVTDALSDLCFTTCREANDNLLREGVAAERIWFVGNVMIDTLLRHRHDARRPKFWDELRLAERAYAVLTLHRPSNVDDRDKALAVLRTMEPVLARMPVVFPMHPRSRKMFEKHGLTDRIVGHDRLHLTVPLGYLEFLYLMDHACLVMTDSGGIQEETTVLGVPCLTLRSNTERAITVEEGTNKLVGLDAEAVGDAVTAILGGKWSEGSPPEKWDGKAAERIADIVLNSWAGSRGLA